MERGWLEEQSRVASHAWYTVTEQPSSTTHQHRLSLSYPSLPSLILHKGPFLFNRFPL